MIIAAFRKTLDIEKGARKERNGYMKRIETKQNVVKGSEMKRCDRIIIKTMRNE